METSLALTGKGYVVIVADTTSARSIVKMKVDKDKMKTSPCLVMAYSGEPGRFCVLSNAFSTERIHPVAVSYGIGLARTERLGKRAMDPGSSS
jgi:20S proteasome alpha/beta subunit